MSNMLSYFLFIIGFFLLVKGADWLVDGASSLAKKTGISTIVIGLTIVSFGTSMPEFVVNILASVKGTADIALGNILGSNIFNILFILGLSMIVRPLIVKNNTIWKEIPLAILAVVVLWILASDVFLDNAFTAILSRADGMVMILFFLIFLYYIMSIRHKDVDIGDKTKTFSYPASNMMILAGIGCLVLGGKWIVDGAVLIAESLGVSEALIGLTIVAIGTSLPELATSVVAAVKKNSDIAVGNIVGSNIFNIFWVLGVTSLIRPLPVSSAINADILVVLLATLLLFVFTLTGEKAKLTRRQGIIFVTLYVIYVIYLIIRG